MHDVVRVCEPTYKTDELKKAGISVMDLVFDDGTFPPSEVRKGNELVDLSEVDPYSLLYSLLIYLFSVFLLYYSCFFFLSLFLPLMVLLIFEHIGYMNSTSTGVCSLAQGKCNLYVWVPHVDSTCGSRTHFVFRVEQCEIISE